LFSISPEALDEEDGRSEDKEVIIIDACEFEKIM
jgi:hypothetical protein